MLIPVEFVHDIVASASSAFTESILFSISLDFIEDYEIMGFASLLAFLSLSSAHATVALLTRHSSPLGNSSFSLIDAEDATLVAVSSLAFPYQDPYVETCGAADAGFYVVGFPTGAPGAILYQLDSHLNLVRTWAQPADGLTFFDLQWSASLDALFGIAVNGTYGRVISRFDISGPEVVAAASLFTLPTMTFVNASAFDQAAATYYGLLNYFPSVNDPSQFILRVQVCVTGRSIIFDTVLLGSIAYVHANLLWRPSRNHQTQLTKTSSPFIAFCLAYRAGRRGRNAGDRLRGGHRAGRVPAVHRLPAGAPGASRARHHGR